MANNQGPGIWFDHDIEDSIITRNAVRDSRRSGLTIESSNCNIAVDNIITGNDQVGVYVLESQDVDVLHNAVFDNWEAKRMAKDFAAVRQQSFLVADVVERTVDVAVR